MMNGRRIAPILGLGALAAIAGCGRSGLATVMSGPAHAFGHAGAPAETGVEIRGFGGSDAPSDLLPNAGGVVARQLGDDREIALAFGWQVAQDGGAGAYGRLTANLIEWDRIMGVERLTAGGTSLEIGVIPRGKGLCASAAVSWDVRLEAPDRPVLAAFLGFCAAGQ